MPFVLGVESFLDPHPTVRGVTTSSPPLENPDVGDFHLLLGTTALPPVGDRRCCDDTTLR